MSNIRDKVAGLSAADRAKLALRISRRKGQSADSVGKVIQPDITNRFAPFPLTNLQQAYWVGRSSAFESGNVASHCYLELEADLDLQRLEVAWQQLIDRHDMLRAVVLPDGRQQVLESVPQYQIECVDLRSDDQTDCQQAVEAIYSELSHQVMEPAEWPLFDVRAARLADDRVRVFFSIDALIADGWSLFLIFKEWGSLYNDPDTELEKLDISFRDYVLAEAELLNSQGYLKDKEFWQDRLQYMTNGPDLPLTTAAATLTEIKFERRVASLDSARWKKLKERCQDAGLTYNAVLIGAYAKVIAMWSRDNEFLLSVPQFNRRPLHPQVNKVVGEAASFLPLQVSVNNSISFAEHARATQERLWSDIDHSNYTGVQVLRDLARERSSAGGVLVPVVFTAAPQLPDGTDASVGVAARDLGHVERAINQTSQVWLDNHVSEQDGKLVCDWDSVVGLFPGQLSQDMLDAYMLYLQELADNPRVWQLTLGETSALLLSGHSKEQRALLYSECVVPNALVHDAAIRQSIDTPDALALVAGDRQLSYADLNRESELLAARLIEQGIAPGDRVAVCMEKGWEQVVAVLATLRAGAVYVPIDNAVPDERLAYLLDKSSAKVVLTQHWLKNERVWPESAAISVVSQVDDGVVPVVSLPELSDPSALACVIFTSGSTGLPKGVMLSHRGMMNSIACTLKEFAVNSSDRVLGVTALHHDMSMFDLFGVLGAGGVLVLPEPAGRRDPGRWSELMLAHDVTLWNSAPAMMEMLLEFAAQHREAIPQSLRLAFLGGDWIPLDMPERLTAQCSSAKVVSVGGPTETTLWNIWYPVDEVLPDWKSIPYGRPIANTKYYIFDNDMHECPDWVTGVMYVAGPGVALGYLDDAKQSAEKFVQHPVSGERLFCTGDQGRWRSDGTIEFMGRVDFQVKIQGRRIEPGEIEAALRQHSDITQAVVVALGEKRGAKKLAAYFVVGTDSVAPDSEKIRAFLGAKLAEHMVPATYTHLDEIPLTANGKVDRAALPSPDLKAVSLVEPTAVTGPVKQVLAIVQEVLDIDAPAADMNLMSLGANSIDMVRIGNRLEAEFGSRPRMDEIFRLQTVAAMSGWYSDQNTPEDVQDESPQSSGSERVDRIVQATRVMIEPAERDAFKNNRPGVRKDTAQRQFVELPREITADIEQRYRDRRSYRNFSLKPIKLEKFSQFISCMAQLEIDGNKNKFLYASPGGLNPTQVYFHIKPGRIEGVDGGTYYYHPEEHGLMQLSQVAELDRDIHIPFINTPIFDQCAFSVYLVADLNAIVPAYGDRSMHFISLEVGTLSHLLESAAPAAQIGLCQIGTIEFDRIAQHFDLDETHLCVHSMVGGSKSDEPMSAASGVNDPLSKASDLLQRVKELSDEEASELLKQQNSQDKD